MYSGIVITGVGMMGDWGVGRDDFMSLLSGHSTLTAIDKFDFDAHIDTNLVRRADYISLCAFTAAVMALQDAKISIKQEDSTRVGVILGTAHGPLHYSFEYHASLVTGDPKMVSPMFFSDSIPNAPVSHISTALGIHGYTITTQGYCAVTQGLKIAAERIQRGALDVCLVGGADVNHNFLAKLYGGCVAHPKKIATTFGGSGFLILESLDHAQKRGAVTYAHLEQALMITAKYEVLRSQHVPLFDRIDVPNPTKYLLSVADDDKDSELRRDYFLSGISGHHTDCSSIFGYGFAAAESFQSILSVLIAQSPQMFSSFLGMTGLTTAINNVSLLRTAFAGGNSLVVFSRNV